MSTERVPGHNINYHLLTYDENGNERGRDSHGVLAQAQREQPTDVFVFTHGWNGDIPAARQQYGAWIATMASCTAEREHARALPGGFRALLVGLHWPSKAWGDETANASLYTAAELTTRMTARLGGTFEVHAAVRTIVYSALSQASSGDPAPDTLPPDVRQALEFLAKNDNDETAEGEREPFDAERLYQGCLMHDELRHMGLFAPIRVLTFWKMKKRARTFGDTGAAAFVRDVQRAAPGARVHLMGHSFGGIVASGAAMGATRPVASMSLIQGAMALWSFCSSIPDKPHVAGAFRAVVTNRKVSGPIVVSMSVHDRAVGTFYPLGAWSGKQLEYGPGQPPKYGGIGVHGVHGPGVDIEHHPDVRRVERLRRGWVHNVDARTVIATSDGIAGAHNDICHAELGRLVWRAVTAWSIG